MNTRPEKILALQFKYFGDAVFITPALRALRENSPRSELHVLVAAEVAPLLENLPWLTRIWSLPRTRGKARLRDSWPIIRALRRENFDRVVDFEGNDRGALLSFLSGAKIRLAPRVATSNKFRQLCYTQTVPEAQLPPDWIRRHLHLLSAWQIPPPQSLRLEIAVAPGLDHAAARLLPANTVLCHIATSQQKKEWPLPRWAEFHQLATAAGISLAFSAGIGERECALLAQLKKIAPTIVALPPIPDLKLFLSVLARAKTFISGDTGPLHFAAGLGVPIIGLFATGDSLRKAAPIYLPEQIIAAAACVCDSHLENFAVCQNAISCMATISPAQVLEALKKLMAGNAALC